MDSISSEIFITKIVWYIVLSIVIIGVLGNIIAFAVCSRSNLKSTVFSVYFRFIIVIDTLTLLLNTLLQKFMSGEYNLKFYNISNDYCRLLKIIAWVLTVPSGWILVVISLDRYLSIAFPTRFRIRKKRLFQISVCIILVVKDFIYYGQIYFSFIQTTYSYDQSTNQSITASSKCQFVSYDALYWMDVFNSTIIPGSLMLICTLMILKCLFDSKKNLTNHNNTIPNRSIMSKRQQKLALTALSVNLFFFILNIPIITYNLYEYYVYIEPNQNNMIYSLIYLVYYLHYGSSFFINVTINSIFRQEFLALFCSLVKRKSIIGSKYVSRISGESH
jgi:hypothetical protein